jgi:hypothetical protein
MKIGVWTALTYLDLRNNDLSGTLPLFIGDLANLRVVDFSLNNLEGKIPETVGNWSLISSATFSGNSFTGTMPTQFCKFVDNATDSVFVDCNVSCDCCLDFDQCSSN